MAGRITPERWRKASEIFGNVLDLSGPARHAYVLSACEGDKELEDLVFQMLRRHEQIDDFLESPAQSEAQEPQPQAEDHAPLLQTDQRLGGRFRITRLLGVGGMGEVYEAEDEQSGDVVALKILARNAANVPLNVARFRREFILARRIKHQNVCAVHDFVELDGPAGRVHVCVMEMLGGESLATWLRKAAEIPYSSFYEIARQMAEGLDAAHRAGVIHRDFKPGNVMVSESKPTRVTVMDFGIARPVAPSATISRVTLTETGVHPGTYGYMAPELLAGQPATQQADVYSFGVVLREFAFRGGFESAWSAVVDRCTNIDPARRYATAGEAFGRLPKALYSRRKVGAGMAAAISMAGASAAVWRWRASGYLPHGARIVIATAQNSTGDSSLDSVGELLRIQLSHSPQLVVLTSEDIAHLRRQIGLAGAAPTTAADWQRFAWHGNADAFVSAAVAPLGTGFTVSVQIDRRGSSPYLPSATKSHSISARSKALLSSSVAELGTWVRREVGEDPSSISKYDRLPEDVSTPSWEALTYYARAEEALSRYAYGDALTLLGSALAKDPDFTLAATRRGDVLMGQQRHKEGLSQWRDAIRLLGKRSVTRREEVYVRGMYAFDTGEFDEAQRNFRAWALEFPYDWRGHFYQTVPLILSGHAAEAVRNLKRVLELNPGYNRTWAQLVNCYIALGDWTAAQDAVNRLRDSREPANALFKQGSLDFGRGNWTEARERFRELGKSNEPQWKVRGLLYEGLLAMESRDYSAAGACVREDVLLALGPDQDTYRAYSYLLGAFAAWRLREYGASVARIRQALEFEAGPHAIAYAGSLFARMRDWAAARRQQEAASEGNAMRSYAIAEKWVAGEIALAAGDRRTAASHFREASALLPRIAFRTRLAEALEPEERKTYYRQTADASFLVYLDPMKQEPGLLGDALYELKP